LNGNRVLFSKTENRATPTNIPMIGFSPTWPARLEMMKPAGLSHMQKDGENCYQINLTALLTKSDIWKIGIITDERGNNCSEANIIKRLM